MIENTWTGGKPRIKQPHEYFNDPNVKNASSINTVEQSLAVMDQFSLAMQTFETRRKGRC